jgi:hypothetical protein
LGLFFDFGKHAECREWNEEGKPSNLIKTFRDEITFAAGDLA